MEDYKRLQPFSTGLFTGLVEVKPVKGYSQDPVFYVYLHKRPIDGSVFYVGKGCGNRAYVSRERNKHWKHVVEKYNGFDVEIVKENLTEQDAFNLEKELILHYGLANLTNQTLGGVSTTGFKHSAETKEILRQSWVTRLENDPELRTTLQKRLTDVHIRQREDKDFMRSLVEKTKTTIAKKTDEERQIVIQKKTAWMQDEEKVKAAREKLKVTMQDESVRQRISNKVKEVWASKSEEEKQTLIAAKKTVLLDPTTRENQIKACAVKLVVNRTFVFNSIRDLERIFKTNLHKSLQVTRSGKNPVTVFKGVLIELYSDKFSHLPIYNGEEIKRYNISSRVFHNALVRVEDNVFFPNGISAVNSVENRKGSVNAGVDFISKNMKISKPAFGYHWRKATQEEVLTYFEEQMHLEGELLGDYCV
jgi:predicted regulator of amino acid metabolism with ACT domain